jgi:hypothetical protein
MLLFRGVASNNLWRSAQDSSNRSSMVAQTEFPRGSNLDTMSGQVAVTEVSRLTDDNYREKLIMNIKYLVAVLACFCISAPLVAQDSTATAGPFVWSSYANTLNNFIPRTGLTLVSPVVSNFTPDQSIIVTRVQLHAAFGANNGPFGSGSCIVVPSVKITDGTHSVSLQIPNAPTDGQGNFGAVSNDSGPIRLEFPADAKLSVTIVPGDDDSSSFCTATEVNVTVQYRLHAGS